MRVLNMMLGTKLGGIEVAFVNFTQALRHEQVDVLSVTTRDAAITDTLPSGIPHAEIDQSSQFDPRAIWQLHRILQRFQPDICVVHGRRALVVALLARTVFRHRVKIVQVLHRSRFKQAQQCDHLITVSHALREETIAAGIAPANVTYIPNFLTDAPPEMPVRNGASLVIGVLSRLVPQKGFDILLDALGILKQRGLTPHVYIGGVGNLEASLHAQAKALGIESQVHWMGWVKDNTNFYRTIDVFCLPSRSEAFGLVVIAAFLHKLPVVSTRTSGPSEIIRDHDTGLLCDITPEGLADALAEVLQDPALRARLAENGLRESEKYRLEAIAPRITQCLSALLETAPARHAA